MGKLFKNYHELSDDIVEIVRDIPYYQKLVDAGLWYGVHKFTIDHQGFVNIKLIGIDLPEPNGEIYTFTIYGILSKFIINVKFNNNNIMNPYVVTISVI